MRNVRIFLARLVVCAVLTFPLAAQTASIAGFIKDPSGAVVSSATVKLKDTARGAVRTTQSDADGYRFTLLPPGEYELEATATGFDTVRHTGIVLQVDDRERLDVTMQVGTVTTTVDITGAGAGVQTD